MCAARAGIALSEERQLNGYRVRLCVVEEDDVVLLAESTDDAKARANADLAEAPTSKTSRTAGRKRSSRSTRWL
jgi:hypothetical protein